MHDQPWPWWVKLNLWGVKNKSGSWIYLVLYLGLMVLLIATTAIRLVIGKPIVFESVLFAVGLGGALWLVRAIQWVKKNSSFPNPATRKPLNDPAYR